MSGDKPRRAFTVPGAIEPTLEMAMNKSASAAPLLPVVKEVPLLKVHQFTAGRLHNVLKLSLILPRTEYEHTFLAWRRHEQVTAVFLAGQYCFDAFHVETNNEMAGLIIEDVHIEVDESSIFSPQDVHPQRGTLIREGESLSIAAKLNNAHFGRATRLPFVDGLPSTPEHVGVGFYRWAIVLGEGLSRRELINIDVTTPGQ